MYVDTTVFMYAVGTESRHKEACAKILRAAGSDEVVLVTSAETMQEVLHRFRSIGHQEAITPAFELIRATVQRILPVGAEDVQEARRLGEQVGPDAGVSARDLVHAAVARRQGIREILTLDRGFALVPGVVVVDPLTLTGASQP